MKGNCLANFIAYKEFRRNLRILIWVTILNRGHGVVVKVIFVIKLNKVKT